MSKEMYTIYVLADEWKDLDEAIETFKVSAGYHEQHIPYEDELREVSHAGCLRLNAIAKSGRIMRTYYENVGTAPQLVDWSEN